VPEQHGKNASHAEDQRESEEIPLLAEEIYVWIAKKFHAALPSLILRSQHRLTASRALARLSPRGCT
jgi:hypothetical protein